MKRFLASVKKEPRPISQPVTLISKCHLRRHIWLRVFMTEAIKGLLASVIN